MTRADAAANGRIRIRRLDAAAAEQCVPALADVLLDCVAGGASIGFMHPLTLERATAFWQRVAAAVAHGERALLVAEDDTGIVGTVQLVLALPENQPHRADVTKLLVHRRGRRRGVAQQLMQALEQTALEEGRTVLVLDAVTDGDAARLYARMGWQRVGDVPDFALMPDGAFCSTTYFYRALERPPAD